MANVDIKNVSLNLVAYPTSLLFLHVCVYVCVYVGERERERDTEGFQYMVAICPHIRGNAAGLVVKVTVTLNASESSGFSAFPATASVFSSSF